MIEWLFNRGNFMKINRDKRKIFPMILIFLIVFLFAIMINNKVYGSYGEQFWKFLVTRKDSYNVSSNGETTEKKYKGIDDNSNLSESDKSEIRNKWAKVYADANATDPNIEDYLKTEIKAYKAERYYRDPNVTTSTTDAGVDDVISDGDSFIGLGKEDRIDVSNLRTFSRNIYNILLTIGIAVAVISGSIIGIKYMLGSVEEKADIKSLLIPYIAGCVIIFGSFAIWKLVVTILQGV